ncbi:hypothetical protein BDR07DRAFT_1385424 [Suillus spraguei]|nr:hypothetical protein BDR07DRAFT_1385424 [Suillus spraguei]
MPPKKRARCSTLNAQDEPASCRQSSRSNRGVGGHAAQLQKAGEVIAAPVRNWKGQNHYPKLDASDPEENSMAPVQLHQGKKGAPAKPPAAKNATKQKPAFATPPTMSKNNNATTGGSSDRFRFKAPTLLPAYSILRRHLSQGWSQEDQLINNSALSEDSGDNEGDLDGGGGGDIDGGDIDGGNLGQEHDWEDEPMDVEDQDNETYDVLQCHQAWKDNARLPHQHIFQKLLTLSLLANAHLDIMTAQNLLVNACLNMMTAWDLVNVSSPTLISSSNIYAGFFAYKVSMSALPVSVTHLW